MKRRRPPVTRRSSKLPSERSSYPRRWPRCCAEIPCARSFSWRASKLVSRATPWLEGLVGASLLSGVALPAASAAAMLSLVFCGVLFIARRRGVEESCRCFGLLDSDRLSYLPMARASVLAAGALLLSLLHVEAGSAVWNSLWQTNVVVSTIPGVLTGLGYVCAFALLEQVRHFEQRRPRQIRATKIEVSQIAIVRNTGA